ncbi:hypothetical protein ACQKGC_18890 [Allorhizobium pseudoryzae]|uniref:hypothetical protein n=1 Tax=Allorhizobium pseudoryzae TaxID=379684 RepID=UPI003D02F353
MSYDEPKILSSQLSQVCLMGADVGQAFGSSLAMALTRLPPANALKEALLMMRDQGELIRVLQEISPDLQAIRRLNGQRAAEVMGNVLSWGCPVILT